MTNEEKALNLSQKYGVPKHKNREIAVYQSCVEMAEWKDNILREEREKAIEKFNEYYDNHLSLSMASRYAGIVFFVDKLLGEDSRDGLHCAFVTLD